MCDVPDAVTAALRAFALANGKRWKSLLCRMWEKAEGSSELIQARNTIGPKRLYKLDI